MKVNKLCFLFFASTLVLLGCTSKPDDSFVEKAVREEISKSVPSQWMNGPVEGGRTKITSVKIIEWGAFNREGKYWPVKVKVSGSANPHVGYGPDDYDSVEINFDEIGEFRFSKDDYDKWQWKLM